MYFQPIRFVRFDNKLVNRGFPVLGGARGLDFLAQSKWIAGSGDENDIWQENCSSFANCVNQLKQGSATLS